MKILSGFLRQNNTGKVLRNTSYLTLSEIILKTVGTLWVIYLARTFSVEIFGEYNLVTSFIAIFSFLPDFGVGLIVIREIAKNRRNTPSYLGNSFILDGILSAIAFVIIIASASFTGFNHRILILITISAVTLIVSTFRSVAIFYFDGVEKMHYSALLNTLNTVFLILFAFVGVFLGFGLYGVFIGMLIGTFISFMVSWGIALKFTELDLHYNRKTVIFYLREGTPLGIAALGFLIYTNIEILILARFLGSRSVGIYSAASPFAFALIQLLNVPFVVAVYPALSRLAHENKKRFRQGILKSIAVILLWSVPSTVFVSFLSPVAIPFIFGRKYNEAIPVLQQLIFFVPFISVSALLYKILIVVKRQKDYLFISIFGAILNVLLNLGLIMRFGIFGAVYSTILTQAVLTLIYSLDIYIKIYRKNK